VVELALRCDYQHTLIIARAPVDAELSIAGVDLDIRGPYEVHEGTVRVECVLCDQEGRPRVVGIWRAATIGPALDLILQLRQSGMRYRDRPVSPPV
jgi:hypothetical protein